jgi:hypothetical protein
MKTSRLLLKSMESVPTSLTQDVVLLSLSTAQMSRLLPVLLAWITLKLLVEPFR